MAEEEEEEEEEDEIHIIDKRKTVAIITIECVFITFFLCFYIFIIILFY